MVRLGSKRRPMSELVTRQWPKSSSRTFFEHTPITATLLVDLESAAVATDVCLLRLLMAWKAWIITFEQVAALPAVNLEEILHRLGLQLLLCLCNPKSAVAVRLLAN